MRTFASSFTHEQKNASNLWEIAHGLKGRPAVQVSVNYEGKLQLILPMDIQYVDDSNIKVYFSQPFTGIARLV